MREFVEVIRDNPVIAAVQTRPALERALELKVPTIFLLNTDIFCPSAGGHGQSVAAVTYSFTWTIGLARARAR